MPKGKMNVYGICDVTTLPELTHNELKVYITLSSFQGNSDYCFPSLKEIVIRAGLMEKRKGTKKKKEEDYFYIVSLAIKGLMEKQWIERERRFAQSSIYRVFHTFREIPENGEIPDNKKIPEKGFRGKSKDSFRKIPEKSIENNTLKQQEKKKEEEILFSHEFLNPKTLDEIDLYIAHSHKLTKIGQFSPSNPDYVAARNEYGQKLTALRKTVSASSPLPESQKPLSIDPVRSEDYVSVNSRVDYVPESDQASKLRDITLLNGHMMGQITTPTVVNPVLAMIERESRESAASQNATLDVSTFPVSRFLGEIEEIFRAEAIPGGILSFCKKQYSSRFCKKIDSIRLSGFVRDVQTGTEDRAEVLNPVYFVMGLVKFESILRHIEEISKQDKLFNNDWNFKEISKNWLGLDMNIHAIFSDTKRSLIHTDYEKMAKFLGKPEYIENMIDFEKQLNAKYRSRF